MVSINTGLATGIDTGSLINQLMQAERRPLVSLQTRKAKFQSQSAAYDVLKNNMEVLKNSATNLDGLNQSLTGPSESDELFTLKATSSKPETLAVTASDKAVPGAFTVHVGSLAKSTKLAHNGFAAKDTALSPSNATLVLNVGTEQKTVNLTGGETTLEGLRDSINALGADVKASIIDVGSGANPFRLIISGAKTGLSEAVNIDASSTLSGFAGADFTTSQAAADAAITIDGVNVTRGTNTITDLVEGVTIDLLKTQDAGETVEISVARDDEVLKGKVASFVNAFNNVLGFFNTQFGSSQSKASGTLSGDRLLISIQSQLRNFLNQPSSQGIPLSDLGINTNEAGLLTFDADKFLNLLKTNPGQIKNAFAQSGEGIAVQLTSFLEGFTDPVDGFIKNRQDGLKSSVDSLNTQIQSTERRLEKREANLRKQFINLEKIVSGLQNNQNFLLGQLQSLEK